MKDLFAFEVRIVAKDVINGTARTDLANNRDDGNRHSPYAGFASHDARLLSDSIKLQHS